MTIDAMGCQKKIVKHIVEPQAEKVISLKGKYRDGREEARSNELENEHRKTLFYQQPCGTPESLRAMRGHLAIESSRPWVLGIACREDECRIRGAN